MTSPMPPDEPPNDASVRPVVVAVLLFLCAAVSGITGVATGRRFSDDASPSRAWACLTIAASVVLVASKMKQRGLRVALYGLAGLLSLIGCVSWLPA